MGVILSVLLAGLGNQEFSELHVRACWLLSLGDQRNTTQHGIGRAKVNMAVSHPQGVHRARDNYFLRNSGRLRSVLARLVASSY